jgi:transposase
LALAAVYDGVSRTETAQIGGMTLQIVRDWVVRFNAQGPTGLVDRKAPGQASRLNNTHRAALAAVLESGPIPATHGVARWRLVDLCQWLWEEHRVTVAKQTMSREVRALGYRKLSARPRHHAQAEDAIENFKNVWPAPSASAFTARSDQSTPTYPVSGHRSGQDGDPRVPVLINFTASSATFLARIPERRSTVRPSRFHHPQTSSAASAG